MKKLQGIILGIVTIFMVVELGSAADSTNNPSGGVNYLSFLSLLLSEDSYSEYADRYVLTDTIGDNDKSVTVYKQNALITEVVLETTTGVYRISATFIEQAGHTRIATVVDDGEKSFTIVFFTPTSLLLTLKNNLKTVANVSMREQILKDFLDTNGFSLRHSIDLKGLEINIPKDFISTLSGTTYKVKYDNVAIPPHSLQVIDDDPLIAWNVDPSILIEYELPDANDGGVIIPFQTPILINDGNLTISYRETPCLSGEAFLFDLDDLYESKLYGVGNEFYHVCVAHNDSELVAGSGTNLFSYTANGEYRSGSTGDTVVQLASLNNQYQISIKESATNPDPSVYSCLGSYNTSSYLFGDCGYTTNRIWIGVVSNIEPGTCTDGGAQTVMWEGREWQGCYDEAQYTWEEAKAHCDNLVFGGGSNWRLPTLDELKSLVVCTNGTPTPLQTIPNSPSTCGDGNPAPYDYPTIDPAFSSGACPYWTATEYSDTHARYVGFFDGGSPVMSKVELNPLTRCVR